MAEPEFRFREPLRVRWAEIDAQAIVFNAHYLMYIDTAIAGYWRALGLPYVETMQALGGDLYVRKATLEYHASARYDDRLEVGIRCTRIGTSSLLFHAEVQRGRERLVSGELVYVYADPATQTSRPVPPALRAVFEAYEAGATMIEVRSGPWSAFEAQARPLRSRVFIDEQGIPAALEWDADDVQSEHAVAINRLGTALATGRLLRRPDGSARVGRMAVLRGLRGGGVGRAVLEALLGLARQQGATQVELHAQADAVGFYARAGFVAEGEPFDEAGIVHQRMLRLP
ncbi:MAG: YbgC/FadM family acyl-CoA thioesterase [Burkholderiaceae bacterium]